MERSMMERIELDVPKQAFMMIGVPGSGKSTIAKQIVDCFDAEVKSFSLDTCREDFWKNAHAEEYEQISKAEMYGKAFMYVNNNQKGFDDFVESQWKQTLVNGKIVIVDNTHITQKSRRKWIDGLRKHHFHITAVNVMISVDRAVARQKTRGDKIVPDHIVADMHSRFQEVLIPFEADRLINVCGF